MRRRSILISGAAMLTTGAVALAAPGERADIQQRRLANRLELWSNFARRTQNMTARYTSTRHSSLLTEPLTAIGTLAFVAPDRLILRDDGNDGSTTRVEGGVMSIVANQAGLPAAPAIHPARQPAAAWLGELMVRLFAPAEGQALIAGCRYHIPKTRTYKLELLPPRGSAVRKVLRTVTLTFDPVGGAITEIEIHESQGDRLHLGLRDHRQNVADEDIARIFGG